jgi:sarcosine oxidase subunit beta
MTTLNTHYDVIIIGAGSIGTPAAFELSKAGYKTLVLDSAASVGQGSNKRAIGGIRATHSDPAKIGLCLRSIEIFSSWKEMYGDEIEWYQGGYCFVAYEDREKRILQDLLEKQKTFGLNTDWYDGKQLLEIIPDINPNGILGGTFSPEDGNASPLLSIHSFYRQAVKHGASFHFHEKVQAIILNQGRVSGVRTYKDEYATDIVINAAGSWAKEVGKLSGLDLPITPDSHESGITEPVARFLDPMIVDIRPAPGSSNFYFYQHFTGQIVFCITPFPNIWGMDTRETSAFLPMVAKRMIEVIPRLANIRVRRTWRGLYPMTPDGFPIVGWAKDISGLLLAVGMCGQGFMLGPGLAELLLRIVSKSLTKKDQEILSYLSPERNFTAQELLK